jgi:hypothetical protein
MDRDWLLRIWRRATDLREVAVLVVRYARKRIRMSCYARFYSRGVFDNGVSEQ